MNIAVCVESGNARGMGHIYRSLLLVEYMIERGETCRILINDHAPGQRVLEESGVPFEVVDLEDLTSQWESELIRRHRIDLWVNDRMETSEATAQHVKGTGAGLVTFDDRGPGCVLSDLHIAALRFSQDSDVSARRTLKGVDYLILSPEVGRYRRLRSKVERTVMTFGGVDRFGVTLKVTQWLKELELPTTVQTGPGFKWHEELRKIMEDDAGRRLLRLADDVPSLSALFAEHDLAITGGGITPFEATGAGLPCLIVPKTPYEVLNGSVLHDLGAALVVPIHSSLTREVFEEGLAEARRRVEEMSRRGLSQPIPNGSLERIHQALREVAASRPASPTSHD